MRRALALAVILLLGASQTAPAAEPIKIGAFFARLATQRGLLMTCDEFGNVIFTRAAAGPAPRAHQRALTFTIFTTESITGTLTSTPTTVASAAPD